MSIHIDTARRKELVEGRYIPIIKQILTWKDPKYSELDLFKSILIELNASQGNFYDHIGTYILTSDGLFNEYQELKQDISENFTEYKSLLLSLVKSEIENNYKTYIKYINDIDKYLLLM
jgi:hypothetical protein